MAPSPDPHAHPSLAATRWSSETKHIRAHGAYVNLVEDTFARHEDAIVALARLHKVKRVFFTGQSLGGGLANVAHLCVRGQLKKAGSPWAELNGKVAWLAYTFAAPQTIVRKYAPENTPRLMADLDDSSYNVVYGCDAVPRYPGMLTYLGAVVELVVPDIVNEKLILPKQNSYVKEALLSRRIQVIAGLYFSLPPLARLAGQQKVNTFLVILAVLPSLVLEGPVRLINFLKRKLENPADAVEFLKKKGLAEVMGQFTHTGTVLYKETENQTYITLKGKVAIEKKLDDVKGAAFKELQDNEEKAKSLLDAHMYFEHFEFGK